MSEKAQATLIGGIVRLVGGIAFIWLLITLWSSGALTGLVGNKGFIMFAIAIFVLWLLTKKR